MPTSTSSEPPAASINSLMRLCQRDAHKKRHGTEIVESEMHGGQLVLGERRKGAIEQPEQHHRGPADEIDMGVQMRLIEALVDADPDPEGKTERRHTAIRSE